METAQQRQSRQDVIEQQRQLEREQEKARLAQEQREQRQRQLQEEEEQRRQQLQRQWQALETGVSIEVLPPSKPYWLGRDFELSLKIVNGRSREIASGSELVCEQTKYNNPKMTVLRSAVGKWTSSAPDPISINVECKSCPPFESWRDAWEALPNEFQFTLIEHREHGELLTNLRVPVSFSWFLGALSDPVAYYNILCFGGANQGKSSSIQTQLTMSCAREVLKGWVVTSGTVEHGTKIYNLHHKLPCPLRFFDTKGVLASEAGSPGKQQYPVHTLNHMIEGKLPLGSDIGMTEQLMALEQRARLATDVPLVGTPAQFVAQTAAAKPEEVDPLNRIHAMALFVPYEDFMPERVESDTAAAHCEMYKVSSADGRFFSIFFFFKKKIKLKKNSLVQIFQHANFLSFFFFFLFFSFFFFLRYSGHHCAGCPSFRPGHGYHSKGGYAGRGNAEAPG